MHENQSSHTARRLIIASLLLALAVSACDKESARQLATTVPRLMTALPPMQPAGSGTPMPKAATANLSFAGVSFSVDPSRAATTKGQIIRPVPGTDAPAFGGAAPAHVLFAFGDPSMPDLLDPRAPQLRVFPASDFGAIDFSIAKAIGDLKSLLSARPATVTQDIPVLPLFNATQVLRSQVEYLDFKNGSGVRFLTAYSPEITPVTNANLFYNFQGLTGDGQYYVTFYYPIAAPGLPESLAGTPAEKDMDSFVQSYDAYLDGAVNHLNALRPEQFTPGLGDLDAMVASLTVAPSAALQAFRSPARLMPAVSLKADKVLEAPNPARNVPATLQEAGEGLAGVAPNHVLISFGDQAVPDMSSPRAPQLRVFPAPEYGAADPAIVDAIGKMKELVVVKPARVTETLPVLPVLTGTQIFRTQVKYLPFDDGIGARFITAYSPDVKPVTNEDLFYTYQGFTNDGKWYVSLYYPITTNLLPRSFRDTPAAKNLAAFAKGYDRYLTNTVRMLSSLGPLAFNPRLDALDRMVQSIVIREGAPAQAGETADPGALAPSSGETQPWTANAAEPVNVRAGAGTQYKPIAKLQKGETVYLFERNDDGTWVRVRLEYGVIGWVKAQYLKTDAQIVELPVALPEVQQPGP